MIGLKKEKDMKKFIMLTALASSIFGAIITANPIATNPGKPRNGAFGIPVGSYLSTCNTCSLSCDGILICNCQKIDKTKWIEGTSVNITDCPLKDGYGNASISNTDGILTCDK